MSRLVNRLSAAPSAPLRRVAAYCRVSSDRDEQLRSLENQRSYFARRAAGEPDWELVEIYCEAGVSGTHQATRPELQRLLGDCRRARIDLILVKSISRFARNAAECLALVRELNGLGVDLFFEKENLRTDRGEGELLLSILASLAESESRSISLNCQWAVQKRFQNGSFKLSRPPYGYDLRDGQLSVNPQEAEIVRHIFSRVVAGDGTPTIARTLNERGVPTKRGGQWQAGTLLAMIKNELFVGDLLMQKTYRDEEYRARPNRGERDRFLIPDHHEALVSRELFAAANKALARRAAKGEETREVEEQPHHCFSGKLFCAACGEPLKRQITHRLDGPHPYWICRRHLKSAASCPGEKVWEEEVENRFATLFNKLLFSYKKLLLPLWEEEQDRRSSDCRLASIDTELEELVRRFSAGELEPSVYHTRRAELLKQAQNLRAEEQLMAASFYTALDDLRRALLFRSPVSRFYPEDFTRFADFITVDSPRKLCFHLACGLDLVEPLASPGEQEGR